MSEILLGGSEFYDKIYEDNLKQRRIILNNDIDVDCVERVMLPILNWNEEDQGKPEDLRKPIQILLNSPGGSVGDGFVLCNIIEKSKTPVHITTLGLAASMGCYLAMCGTKGKRKCYEFTTFLIHSGSMVVGGNTNDVESTVKYYTDMKKDIEDFIYRHTDITPELYKSHQKDEWYLSAKEALNYGIVDEII